MASRRKGRILAFQALYAWEVHHSQTGNVSIPENLLDFSWAESFDRPQDKQSNKKQYDKDQFDKNQPDKKQHDKKQLDEKMTAFSRLLVSGTVENISAVDSMIREHLQNWELERLNSVDLAVLRMSVYTLMFQAEMPPSVVIDEAIEISRQFGTNDSYRFVNGVLDSVRKNLDHKRNQEL